MVKRFISNEHLMIARGLSYIYETGNKLAMRDPLATTLETVWNGPAAANPFLPTSAAVLNITSDVAGDTAIPVTIQGLDADYREIEETVTLNGTTIVNTTQQFIRVNRAFNSGSTEATGNISINHGANVLAYIAAGYNQTLTSQYTVPAGKTLYLFSVLKTAGKGSDTELSFMSRELNKVWRVKHVVHLLETPVEHDYLFPQRFNEKSDIRVQGFSRSTATDVTASYEFVLVNHVD